MITLTKEGIWKSAESEQSKHDAVCVNNIVDNDLDCSECDTQDAMFCRYKGHTAESECVCPVQFWVEYIQAG